MNENEVLELYSYHRYYSNHITDDSSVTFKELHKAILKDTAIYDKAYPKVHKEMDEEFDSFIHLIMRKWITDEDDVIIEKLMNPGRLTMAMVDELKTMEDRDRAELLLTKALIYLEHHSGSMEPFDPHEYWDFRDYELLTPTLWMIFVVQLYKDVFPEPKYKQYLGERIDLNRWDI